MLFQLIWKFTIRRMLTNNWQIDIFQGFLCHYLLIACMRHLGRNHSAAVVGSRIISLNSVVIMAWVEEKVWRWKFWIFSIPGVFHMWNLINSSFISFVVIYCHCLLGCFPGLSQVLLWHLLSPLVLIQNMLISLYSCVFSIVYTWLPISM